MSAEANKRLLQEIFTQLAAGNAQPYVDAMADDFTWTVSGSSTWGRKYVGKQAVTTELFGLLRARLTRPIRTVPDRYLADGDIVVVEAHGDNWLKSNGLAYRNNYCFVFQVTDGKLRSATEYMDTELATAILGAP